MIAMEIKVASFEDIGGTRSFSLDLLSCKVENPCCPISLIEDLAQGKNKRIQLNSREISSKSNLFWNESFSLECLGTDDSINNLKQETVVFELKWRNTNPILAKIGGSQLLGRAEVPWKTVLESPNLEMKSGLCWFRRRAVSLMTSPSVQIAMRARVPEMAEMAKKNRRNGRLKGRGCCKDSGCRCEDYDIFALVVALEAL
ncbi:hypothetical protein DKX38_007418 [Salix brachista]|uniref:C2 domain-containing protein n=1 Tax=Salix brachista TaxID=2182728 RepID=A0A5N5MN76_9ROSI|nr:hypothetical protein DKX38_007418 [Salix brachista]